MDKPGCISRKPPHCSDRSLTPVLEYCCLGHNFNPVNSECTSQDGASASKQQWSCSRNGSTQLNQTCCWNTAREFRRTQVWPAGLPSALRYSAERTENTQRLNQCNPAVSLALASLLHDDAALKPKPRHRDRPRSRTAAHSQCVSDRSTSCACPATAAPGEGVKVSRLRTVLPQTQLHSTRLHVRYCRKWRQRPFF